MNKINLPNRYGEPRVLEEVRQGLYSTSGFKNVAYVRVSQKIDSDEFEYIDFDNGPMIGISGLLPTGERVVSIVFEDGRYLIKTDKYGEDSSNEQLESGDNARHENERQNDDSGIHNEGEHVETQDDKNNIT